MPTPLSKIKNVQTRVGTRKAIEMTPFPCGPRVLARITPEQMDKRREIILDPRRMKLFRVIDPGISNVNG
jgi:hypothetical protein